MFKREINNEKILGAVGILQFEVVKFRLENEYKVKADYQGHQFIGIRWLKFGSDNIKKGFIQNYKNVILKDNKNRICFGIKSDWDLKLAIDKNPDVEFYINSDYKK